jgi:hypothetical protein
MASTPEAKATKDCPKAMARAEPWEISKKAAPPVPAPALMAQAERAESMESKKKHGK